MELISDEIHFFLLVPCIFILGALSVFLSAFSKLCYKTRTVLSVLSRWRTSYGLTNTCKFKWHLLRQTTEVKG